MWKAENTYVSYSHGLAFLGGTVELLNGGVGVVTGVHLDETESSGLAYLVSQVNHPNDTWTHGYEGPT